MKNTLRFVVVLALLAAGACRGLSTVQADPSQSTRDQVIDDALKRMTDYKTARDKELGALAKAQNPDGSWVSDELRKAAADAAGERHGLEVTLRDDIAKLLNAINEPDETGKNAAEDQKLSNKNKESEGQAVTQTCAPGNG